MSSLSRPDKSGSVGASRSPSTVAAVTRTDPEGLAATATTLVLHQPPATDSGLSVRYGPEGYPSPPSSVWSRSVSAVSSAIADSSSHFWTSPPRRALDRGAQARGRVAHSAP